jgi:hypothetical protein
LSASLTIDNPGPLVWRPSPLSRTALTCRGRVRSRRAGYMCVTSDPDPSSSLSPYCPLHFPSRHVGKKPLIIAVTSFLHVLFFFRLSLQTPQASSSTSICPPLITRALSTSPDSLFRPSSFISLVSSISAPSSDSLQFPKRRDTPPLSTSTGQCQSHPDRWTTLVVIVSPPPHC